MSKSYSDWIEHFAKNFGQMKVVTPADGELADIIVCHLVTDPLMMPDNLVAVCRMCPRLIQFRPHAPKRPPKVCDECATAEMAKHKENLLMVTETTAADVQAFRRKKKQQ